PARNRARPEQTRTMDDFVKRLPFIEKKEILDAQAVNPPFGQALATSEDFFHQRFATSGSTGAPLHIPLPSHSAELGGESWVSVYWAAGLRARHSFYFPFNWGIFAAFWSAYMGVRRLGATGVSGGGLDRQAAAPPPRPSFYLPFNWGIFAAFWSAYMGVRRLGATVVSGGGLDSKARLRQIERYRPEGMRGAAAYALYLGETAREMGVDLAKTSITHMIVSGEPGGSIPATRHAIEQLWGARCYELYGVAEIGPTNPGCPLQEGNHLCEDWYHALVVDESGNPVRDGQVGEHIVTSYIQDGQPLIKYRTHDLVRRTEAPCGCGTTWLYYPGGVLGRTDHMIIVDRKSVVWGE